MKHLIAYLRSALAALAFSAFFVPAPVPAATVEINQTVTKTFQTTFVRDYGPSVPYTGGTLRLTLTPDGYVHGFFTPADTADFIPVIGGRRGADVWFDIGQTTSTTRVTASLQDGSLNGYATTPSGAQYKFTAVPQLSPG